MWEFPKRRVLPYFGVLINKGDAKSHIRGLVRMRAFVVLHEQCPLVCGVRQGIRLNPDHRLDPMHALVYSRSGIHSWPEAQRTP